jgi:NADH:ubiquinone oxidoreductase subunit 4 (subunit M)
MLWSGLFWYLLFYFFLSLLVFCFFRLNNYFTGYAFLLTSLNVKTQFIFLLFFLQVFFLQIYLIFYSFSFDVFLTLPNLSILTKDYYGFYLIHPAFSFFSLDLFIFPYIYIFLLITFFSIVFCLSYNFNELYIFFFYCLVILIVGMALFLADSFIVFFFFYELLLLPSFFILYRFAKTRRCIEASYLMFFWTQFGALFLFFSFFYLFLVCGTSSFTVVSKEPLSNFEVNFLFICWFLGFGVKFPIWPFYGWLPKAHVEASTNFSIFLSGVLVKFAFFGFLKCLLVISSEPTFFFCYPFLIIGILDSVFKLFYQIDLKKLIAFATVVEMHWLTICFISGQTALWVSGFCMLVSHALLSTNSFILVDSISRRFNTRLVTEFSGLNFLTPKLFLSCLFNCIIFLGFPGSIFFIAEFLFFTFSFDLLPIISLLLFVLIYLLLPTFFSRTWFNVMFSSSVCFYKQVPQDLDSRELIFYGFMFFTIFWLGFTWQSFIL